MWQKFQEEQFNRKTIEKPYGFITYQIFEDNSAYIHLIYIKENERGRFRSKSLEAELLKRHPKITSFYCYVDLTSNKPEQSLACILKAGYKIDKANQDKIVLYKEVRNG